MVDTEAVVARIGDRTVTAGDLQAEARHLRENGRPAMTKEALLDAMLAHEAQLLRAQELVDDPDLQRAIDRLMVTRLRERELVGRLRAAEVSEEEIRTEYDRNLETYTPPAMDRFAMLFLRIGMNASENKQQETRSRMDTARQLAMQQTAQKDFGKLALDYSDDQLGRYRGGDTGWISQNKISNRLPETVLGKGRSLSLGETSGIIEADDGLYIIRKTDHRPSMTTPFAQVRSSLRKRLLAERRKQIEADFVDTCLLQAAPEIDQTALEKLKLETGIEPPEASALQGGLPVAGN